MSNKGGFWGGLGQLGSALWGIGAAIAMVWAFFAVINFLVITPILWLCGVRDEEKRAYFTLGIRIAFSVVGIPGLCTLDATVGKSIRAREAYNDLRMPLTTHKEIVVDVTYANTSTDILDQIYNAARGKISKGQWDQFVAKFDELGRSGTVAEDRAQLRLESQNFHLVGSLQWQPEIRGVTGWWGNETKPDFVVPSD